MTASYSTQMEAAKLGIVTPQMERVAAKEGRDPEFIRAGVAAGRIAIPANHNHAALDPWGVGEGLSTKINVNLGVSGDLHDYEVEMRKVDMALSFGVEGIMDLSNCGKTSKFRRDLIAKSSAMVGTVPMYDAIGYLEKPLASITWEDLFEVVEAHAKDGVDFVTIHAGINRRAV